MVTTEGDEVLRIEKALIRPLLRGRDMKAWKYSVSNAIIWTHDDKTGEVLESLPNRAEAYFTNHAGELQGRDDYKVGMPSWTIFRVSPEKLGLKVAWKKYGTEMQSAMVERDHAFKLAGGKLLVPLQTVYFIPVERREDGLLLAGVFNSIPFKTLMMSFAVRARGAYFHYTAWIVGLGVLPVSSSTIEESWRNHHGEPAEQETLNEIVRLSKLLHSDISDAKRSRYADQLERAVVKAYHLTPGESKTLQDYYTFMRPPQEAQDLLEQEDAESDDA